MACVEKVDSYTILSLYQRNPFYHQCMHINLPNSDSPSHTSGTSPIGFIYSPLSFSVSPLLCHSRLKPRVHSVLEKSLKMLEFGIKTSRPLKVLENR